MVTLITSTNRVGLRAVDDDDVCEEDDDNKLASAAAAAVPTLSLALVLALVPVLAVTLALVLRLFSMTAIKHITNGSWYRCNTGI